jgi:chorismate dehydratase
MLKVGRIQYANCTPLFHALALQPDLPEFELITGVPAVLNRLLANGEIDVCPSSSIEYAYHQHLYRILPHLSISSNGAVASVLLFSTIPISELDGYTVLLSAESATSVNLLKVLLKLRYGCSCHFVVAGSTEAAGVSDDVQLLIGDAALRRSLSEGNRFVYDLGNLWYAWTGYPFVFALWLCRRDIAEKAELKKLAIRLVSAKAVVPGFLEQIVAMAEESDWMGHARLLEYWRTNISYHLDEQAQDGLLLYYTKCFELGLIPSVPVLDFVRY